MQAACRAVARAGLLRQCVVELAGAGIAVSDRDRAGLDQVARVAGGGGEGRGRREDRDTRHQGKHRNGEKDLSFLPSVWFVLVLPCSFRLIGLRPRREAKEVRGAVGELTAPPCRFRCPLPDLRYVDGYPTAGSVPKLGPVTTVPYRIRRSNRALHARILVDAEGVEVVVPRHFALRNVEPFVQEKRPWIERTLRRMRESEEEFPRARLCDGGEVPYLGERLSLSVETEH